MAVPNRKWTVEEYLKFERESLEKHEFLNGEIIQFAGASAKHNLILGNTYASLHTQLRQRDCVIYPSDMRLKIRETGLFTYPDAAVVCGQANFSDDKQDTLLNPALLVEVLSPSTESYDRGRKFQHYRTVESLQEYILISQNAPRIERYVRQPEGRWLLFDYAGFDAVVALSSIECTLALADVYEKITFADDE